MLERENPMRADAIRWHIRLRDGRAEDWDAFMLWLEESPAHAAEYDAVALADDGIEALLRQPVKMAANDDEPSPGAGYHRRYWFGGLAAVAALAVAVFVAPLTGTDRYEIQTGAGERRTIALGEGSAITLNGSTTITLDHKDKRFAALDSGEAIFTVRHDEKAPFIVELGANQVKDVGTVFNIIRTGSDIRVEVSEGEILYNPGRAEQALKAGQSLHDNARKLSIGRINPAQVGRWQQGRLTFHAAPLSTVATDLARNLGTPVSIDPKISGRLFSGTIQVDKDQQQLFKRLEILLAVDARPSANGWTISASGRAPQ